MKPTVKNISLTPYDDIFQSEESRIEAHQEKVVDIHLTELHPFKQHPFKVVDDEAMKDTAESIAKHGVLVPAIARPREKGGYELVSGHRRKRASELAGRDSMPVIIRNLDDDAATIIMVDSNIQRENILPSERAFAYKMKLDAMKRQGARNDLTSGQLGQKSRYSVEIIADQAGESAKQVQRHIRLTELVPEFLDLVDGKKIASTPPLSSPSSSPPNKSNCSKPWIWNRLPHLSPRPNA